MKKCLPILFIVGFLAIVAFQNKPKSKVYDALNNNEVGTFTEVDVDMKNRIRGVNNEKVVFGFSALYEYVIWIVCKSIRESNSR